MAYSVGVVVSKACQIVPWNSDLQTEFPRAILPEQTPVPDVAPYHLHAPMPGLVHERTFRSSSNRGRRGVPGTEGVSGEPRRI
jgi:hypothetical protein